MPEYSTGSTLLVGVGGIGCLIADRVYAIARANGTINERNQLEILAFDTDVSDLGRVLKHIPVEQRIQTSVAGTVQQIFDQNAARFQNWFLAPEDRRTEIMEMQLIDGAGAVRMLSRMAFDAALRSPDVRARIQRPIDRLRQFINRPSPDDVVNVMIVGSLAGGTGSGMFLQTALYLWQTMHDSNIKTAIRGIFVLPDVVVNATNIPESQHDYVRYNGYAALKELNAVQLATSGRLDDSYRTRLVFNYFGDNALPENTFLLRNVAFIDYRTLTGGNLGRNPDAYLSMAARTAYYLLFTPLGARERGVAVNDVRTRLEDPNNHYAGIGSYGVTYPRADILDYLALRFAASVLDDSWLKPDDAVRAAHEDWVRRVRMGEDLRRLDMQLEYMRAVDTLAEQPGAKLAFEAIRRSCRPMAESEDGERRERVLHLEYLDALERHVLDDFWSASDGVRDARERGPIEGGALGPQDEIARNVQTLERQLLRDEEAIKEALQQSIDRTFRAALAFGEAQIAGTQGSPMQRSASATQLASHHLHRHIFAPEGRAAGPMHPVAARYFLCGLQREIETRAKIAGDAFDEARKRVQRSSGSVLEGTEGYSGERGMPLDARINAIVQNARHASGSSGLLSLGRPLRTFRDEYAACHDETIGALREFAETAVRQRLYQLLAGSIGGLADRYARFFDEVRGLRGDLGREVDDLTERHEGARGVGAGNVYVLASASAKDGIWQQIRARLPGDTGSDAVNDAINRALVSRQFSPSATLAQQEPDLRAEFRDKIVNDVCRQTIEHDYRSEWDLSLVSAIRRETMLSGKSEGEWYTALESYLRLALDHAGPFIQLSDEHAGTPVRYWSVSPAMIAEAGDGDRVRALFRTHSGENPVEDETFPKHAVVCLNLRVNLQIHDLLGVCSGDKEIYGKAAIEGTYRRAYDDLLVRLSAQARISDPLAGRVLTPHLDRQWHLPGVLPELHPAEAEHTMFAAYAAFAAALTHGWIEEYDRRGRAVLRFDDPSRLGLPNRYIDLVNDTNLMAAFAALQARDGAIETILDHARRREEGDGPAMEPTVRRPSRGRADGSRPRRRTAGAAADPRRSDLFRALSSPKTLARIARICAGNEPDAVATAGRLVEAVFRRFRGYALAHLHDRQPEEIQTEINEILRREVKSVIDELRGNWRVSKAVFEEAENVIGGTLERIIADRWDASPAAR